jgi:hypothetical protein
MSLSVSLERLSKRSLPLCPGLTEPPKKFGAEILPRMFLKSKVELTCSHLRRQQTIRSVIGAAH